MPKKLDFEIDRSLNGKTFKYFEITGLQLERNGCKIMTNYADKRLLITGTGSFEKTMLKYAIELGLERSEFLVGRT